MPLVRDSAAGRPSEVPSAPEVADCLEPATSPGCLETGVPLAYERTRSSCRPAGWRGRPAWCRPCAASAGPSEHVVGVTRDVTLRGAAWSSSAQHHSERADQRARRSRPALGGLPVRRRHRAAMQLRHRPARPMRRDWRRREQRRGCRQRSGMHPVGPSRTTGRRVEGAPGTNSPRCRDGRGRRRSAIASSPPEGDYRRYLEPADGVQPRRRRQGQARARRFGGHHRAGPDRAGSARPVRRAC